MAVLPEGRLRFAEGAAGSNAFGFSDGDCRAGGDGREAIDLAAGPADFYGVSFVTLSQAKGQDQFAGGKITGAAAQHLRLRFAASSELHSGADAVAIGLRADQLDAQTVI